VRDEDLIQRLVELERQFWAYVEQDRQPPADGTDSADLALRCLYPQDTGQVIDLSQDLVLASVFSDLLAVRKVIETQTLLEAQLKQRIQQHMGDATRALFEIGEISWKRSKDACVLDVARLLKDRPELLQQYPLVKPGSRRFLVHT